jgi:DNA-directed RNA polymerase subunit alpha
MESNENVGKELFAGQLPSIEDIKVITGDVNSSEYDRLEFLKLCEENQSNKLAAGIGYSIAGQYALAIEHLKKAKASKEQQMFLGDSYMAVLDFDKAIASYDKAAKSGADDLTVSLAKTETYIKAGENEKAAGELKNCGNFEKVSAEYHYQLGKLNDANGDYSQAIKDYNTAVELDPLHGRALFQLAYTADLRGDDEAAIDYYVQISRTNPVYVNALLNLSVLYEDMGEYSKAMSCVYGVLHAHPNHKKAGMFLKDVESSKVMIYDEEKEKQRSKHHQTLEIPISDFELSVRSRNCLKKMNINTIGDLLRTTEAELLAYKNFGETSLAEIKKILSFKGMRLGMALEEKAMTIPKTFGDDQASEEILNKTVNDMELSVRARRCLGRLGLQTLGELASKTEAELLGCKNFGVTSLNEIKDRMAQLGVSLRKLE